MFGYNIIIPVCLSFLASYVLTYVLMIAMRKLNIVAPDYHKPEKPLIPTMCGISILLGFTISSLFYVLLISHETSSLIRILTMLLCGWICAFIGFFDDLKGIAALKKTVLTVLSIIPVIISALMFPHVIRLGRPKIPIIGRLRLTIIYWFLLPLAIAGPANVVNMLEALNGILPLTLFPASITLAISAFIMGKYEASIICILLGAALLGYLPYNKYPAKVFSGNVGSLGVGALIGAIAVIYGLEVPAMIVLSPHLLNAFQIIVEVGGFKAKEEIKRPTKVVGNKIFDSLDNHAPTTLIRVLAGREGSKENEIVNAITLIELVSCAISILFSFLMR